MTSFMAHRLASGFFLIVLCASVSLVPGRASAEGGGQALDLAAYRGKVVVVDFWASWCAPCRRSFPWLDAMQKRYGDDGLVIIGVNEDDVAADAAAFLEEVPVSFRIVKDHDGVLAREFELAAMPSSYVIGRDGAIAARHLGFKTAKQDEYEETLRTVLDHAMAASGAED